MFEYFSIDKSKKLYDTEKTKNDLYHNKKIRIESIRMIHDNERKNDRILKS